MSERQVDVVHLLLARRSGPEPSWLFFPHGRWKAGGAPLLAVPTTKVAVRGTCGVTNRSLGAARAKLWRQELGVGAAQPAGRRLPQVSLALRSPTADVETAYRVAPVAVPLASGEALAARLGGVWLTAREALARPELSPTARAALASVDLNIFAAQGQDDWTCRLAEARWAGDGLGALFEEARPWLTERLRRDPMTRALFRVGDEDDALSDAAMNAVVGLSSFDPARGNARAWLWVITRNAALSVLRERRRHAGVRLGGEEGLLDGAANEGDDPAFLAAGAEGAEHLRQRLDEQLARLTAPVRRAWEMVHLEGHTYKEATEATGVAQGTLASSFYRVRQAMNGEADLGR